MPCPYALYIILSHIEGRENPSAYSSTSRPVSADL